MSEAAEGAERVASVWRPAPDYWRFQRDLPAAELMANKSMQLRHWESISKITGHTFDVESESFLLRNLMEAPLLKNKEDIEVRFNSII